MQHPAMPVAAFLAVVIVLFPVCGTTDSVSPTILPLVFDSFVVATREHNIRRKLPCMGERR